MDVLKRVRLGPRHRASLTAHTLSDASGKGDFPPFTELVIASDPAESSCYLFHACADGQVDYTCHQSVDEPTGQGPREFGVQPEEWTVPDQPETF